ncbi:hypothetical protein D3C85_552920 [compost metagenome]
MKTPTLIRGNRVNCYRAALKVSNCLTMILSSTAPTTEDDEVSIAINMLGYEEYKFYKKLKKQNSVIGTISVIHNHTPEELIEVVDQFRGQMTIERITIYVDSQTDFDTLTAHFAKEQA